MTPALLHALPATAPVPGLPVQPGIGDALRWELRRDVELEVAVDLDQRHALLAEGSRLGLPPRELHAQRLLGAVADPRGVDPRVLVLHLDRRRSGAVAGFRERDREVAVGERRAEHDDVAAAQRDSSPGDHLRVTGELRLGHRSARHPS